MPEKYIPSPDEMESAEKAMWPDQQLDSRRREKMMTHDETLYDSRGGPNHTASSERLGDLEERKEFDSEIRYDRLPGKEALHFQDGESLPLSREALARIEDTIAGLEQHINQRYQKQRDSLNELHERVGRDLEDKEGSRP
jgi:hypothetical protein